MQVRLTPFNSALFTYTSLQELHCQITNHNFLLPKNAWWLRKLMHQDNQTMLSLMMFVKFATTYFFQNHSNEGGVPIQLSKRLYLWNDKFIIDVKTMTNPFLLIKNIFISHILGVLEESLNGGGATTMLFKTFACYLQQLTHNF